MKATLKIKIAGEEGLGGGGGPPGEARTLTVHVFLVSFQALNDASVGLQTAFPELVQVIHHVIVRLSPQPQTHTIHTTSAFTLTIRALSTCQIIISHHCISNPTSKLFNPPIKKK